MCISNYCNMCISNYYNIDISNYSVGRGVSVKYINLEETRYCTRRQSFTFDKTSALQGKMSSLLVDKLNQATVKEYCRIDELKIGQKYKILDLKKVGTKYGPTLLATIEEWVHFDIHSQPVTNNIHLVFLPNRYNNIFSDEEVENYNGSIVMVYEGRGARNSFKLKFEYNEVW